MTMIQNLTKQRLLCRRIAQLQARGLKTMDFCGQGARVKNMGSYDTLAQDKGDYLNT